MAHMIDMSDEELGELDRLLVGEIDDSRVELRRTRNPGFRDHVRHHLEVMEHLHERLRAARHMGSASV